MPASSFQKSFHSLNCFDVSDTSSLVIGTATSRTTCYGSLLRVDPKALLIAQWRGPRHRRERWELSPKPVRRG